MIISRATPAALLMHTAGLGKGWARTAGSPVWIPSGTQRRGHGRSLPQSPGDAALPFIEPKPWRSAGTVLPGRWPRSRETWLLSALHGTASPSRGQLQEMEIPQSWCQHPSLAQPARGWPPHRPCTEQVPEGGSKPGTRLQELILQPLCGTPWQAPLRAAQGPAVPKQSPSPSAAGSLPGGSCGPSSTARHQAVPAAIELRRWVGRGPLGNEPKITGDLESLPVGAPRAGGWGHWALVATEHLAHDGVFGSHSILCLFHSSPSSFSPFKALRLCRTETISWPGPRTWLLRSALSWALSGCQPWQETFFAIPP